MAEAFEEFGDPGVAGLFEGLDKVGGDVVVGSDAFDEFAVEGLPGVFGGVVALRRCARRVPMFLAPAPASRLMVTKGQWGRRDWEAGVGTVVVRREPRIWWRLGEEKGMGAPFGLGMIHYSGAEEEW